MFVSIYFPIFDARDFFPDRVLKTRRPRWPAGIGAGQAFQRNLGAIRPRPQGGVRGWIGESEICEIRSALTVERADGQRLKPTFMRFFSDGWSAAHFSLGLRLPSDIVSVDGVDQALTELLGATLRSRHRSQACRLEQAGDLVGDLYALGTRRGNHAEAPDRLVRSAPPLTFVRIRDPAIFERIQAGGRLLPFKASDDFTLGAGRDPMRPVFYIFSQTEAGHQRARFVRIGLARLYLELFCLDQCLEIMTSPLFGLVDQEGLESLGGRVDQAAKRLTGAKRPSFLSDIDDYDALVDMFSSLYRPGRVEELLSALDRVSARANMRRSVLTAAARQFDLDRAMIGVYVERGATLTQEVKVTNYTNLGQVGAMGDNAKVETLTQNWEAAAGDLDLATLARELETLRASMQPDAISGPQLRSVAAVVEAKEAAEAGDGKGVMAALNKAGTWAFDTAGKIGVGVAIAALKTALGF